MPDATFDCVIAGGGHAGCEAAVALARLGLRTLLVSGNLDRLGYLSCNPAIGGLAKGHMVREIDALGGQMGRWADLAGIQFRVLNRSKGPAVRATRAQMDRPAYLKAVAATLFSTPNLSIWQDNIVGIKVASGRVVAVRTRLGRTFGAKHVLLTTGTFLNGVIHVGQTHLPSGRMGDEPATGLSDCLRDLGIVLGRLKTGTTPRLLRSSIDFSHLEEQFGDIPMPHFSFYGPPPPLPQTSCHVTWTNEKAHAIIRTGFDRSPLFTGIIEGVGARYCPSIEDKVARFPDRERHQIFLEPEGLQSGEVYANGISTSLPLDVQQGMVNAIKGLENAVITRPGYAIEYDYANPVQLRQTLESKIVDNLWFAGQINGTSGYEEAAAQGLWAALNIAAKEKGQPPFLPARSEAYMAVLVDDLVTLGTEEPYRMFTSRAEHRLLLREDNADMRLCTLGRSLGLVDDEQWHVFCARRENAAKLAHILKNDMVEDSGGAVQRVYADILRRPDVSINDFLNQEPDNPHFNQDLKAAAALCDELTLRMVETDIKYAGYIERQSALASRSAKHESVPLPREMDYAKISGLSNEVREKLARVRPASLGQAARISGVTPAAIGCLEIWLRKIGRL